MKTFGQLTSGQKTAAVRYARNAVVNGVLNGLLEFKASNSIGQEMVNKALSYGDFQKSREFFLTNVSLKKDLDRLAIDAAQGSWYSEKGEVVVDIEDSLSIWGL